MWLATTGRDPCSKRKQGWNESLATRDSYSYSVLLHDCYSSVRVLYSEQITAFNTNN